MIHPHPIHKIICNIILQFMLNNYWKPNRWNATHLEQFRHV